jgi:hypothetical protein
MSSAELRDQASMIQKLIAENEKLKTAFFETKNKLDEKMSSFLTDSR